jgi:hypothetical protein
MSDETPKPYSYKQETIGDLLDSERQMVLDAEGRYGKHYLHARECSVFLSRFAEIADHDRQNFALFHALLKKHHLLAVLSTVRRHQVQSSMNLRQVIEAGCIAAFAIANTADEHFADNGDITPRLRGKSTNGWTKTSRMKALG